MPIKGSSAKRIDELVEALGAESAVTRETAVARLTLVGVRAVPRLAALVGSAGPTTARVAALGALEAIADSRAVDAVLAAIDDPEPEVAAMAATSARSFLRGPHESRVLDRLTGATLDRTRHQAVRLAALRTLTTLGASTVAPLFDALSDDPDASVRSAAGEPPAPAAVETPLDLVMRASEQGLPEDPAPLRAAGVQAAATAPLPALLRIIELSREREMALPSPRRLPWTALRGTAHVALASRRSRLGVYDLRESLETAAAPLPADFLSALARLGDTSCLEPIAAAFTRSTRPSEDDWRLQLAEAFRGIVKRERLTSRHSIIKKIVKRYGKSLVGSH